MAIFRMISSLSALVLAAAAPAPEALFDAQGYRIAHYRAPTHQPPKGVRRITTAEAARLISNRDVLFIDVLPAEGGHREPDGRWRLARMHEGIAGSHWLPEAGRGDASPAVKSWFQREIAGLSHHDKGRMIVIYCLSDCWMGWNAAKRLRALGYRNVRWLAEGTDGWREHGLPLVPLIPIGGLTDDQS